MSQPHYNLKILVEDAAIIPRIPSTEQTTQPKIYSSVIIAGTALSKTSVVHLVWLTASGPKTWYISSFTHKVIFSGMIVQKTSPTSKRTEVE